MNKILVVTSDPDPHVTAVAKHLSDKYTIIILDPMGFPDEISLSLEVSSQKVSGNLNGINLSDIGIVWYRKPRFKVPKQYNIEEEYYEYVNSSIRSMCLALEQSLLDRIWVSDYWSIKRAGDKHLQLLMAKRLGFEVPETLITSSSKDALDFLERLGYKAVTKPLGRGYAFSESNEEYYSYFYATSLADITRKDLVTELEGLSMAPSIFQQEIRGGLDIRVTIIGNQVYPCEIHKKLGSEPSNITDWRQIITTNKLEYKRHNLPGEIKSLCHSLLKEFNLAFGVVEFVLTPDGKYWFMEINPNGQWLFIEQACPELEISKGFADYFITNTQ